MLARLAGEYEKDEAEYRFTGSGPLTVYSGPSVENATVPVPSEAAVPPGGPVRVSACWQERGDDGRLSDRVFYKLSSGLGWVKARDLQVKKGH